MLALASQPLSNLDSLEGSDLEGSVNFFCPSELLMIHRPNSLEVSLVSARLADLFRALLVPMFPVLVGESTKFLEGLPCKKSNFPGSLVPALGYFHLVTKKVSWDGFLTLITGLLRCPSFLCEEREINVELI